jgi:diguanylate cyclase (GGDEF)-like protein/putative nucleotidyltransferase with HDIG domain
MKWLKQWSHLQITVVGCSLLYATVFVLMLIFHPGDKDFYQNFHNTYQIIPPLFSALCAIAYARKGQHPSKTHRAGWLLIGLGCLIWSFGQMTWTYYESIRGIDVPYPGLADVGYLGAVPFLVIGVTLLFGSMPVVGRARLLLDSALAASSFGVLSWYFLVEPIWIKAKVPLEKLIGAAYPLGDIVALFSAIVLFNQVTTNKSLRRSLGFLAAGLVLLASGDTLFAYYNLKEVYETGSWFDWMFSFGWLLIGYASLLPLWWPLPASQQHQDKTYPQSTTWGKAVAVPSILSSLTLPALARVLLPYLAAAGSFTVIAVDDYRPDGIIGNSVLCMGLGLILLVIVRQVVTLLENQHLTLQLRAFNVNLEQIVGWRTEQLHGLLELTKAVNSTRDVEQVLAVAATHIRQAMRADAVAIRLLTATDTGSNVLTLGVHEGFDNYPDILNFIATLPMSEQLEERILPANVRTNANVDETGQPEQQTNSHPQAETPSSSSGTYLRTPLLWQGRMIGMISVIRWNTAFEGTEPEMLESIGVEVGTAIENARQYAAAVEAADRDSVTGLYNHRAVHQRLDAEFELASRQESALSVIMMDLNNFKLFNDTYGHPMGDRVLKRVAYVLEMECRKFDILGRYGGDEFIAILPNTDTHLAMGVAQRLRNRMMREGFRPEGSRGNGGHAIPVTLSFGIATYPADSTNRYELLTIADANLYTAKLSEQDIIGTSETQRTSRELRAEGSFGVLDSMVTAVDNKDRYTRRHSEDVTEYSMWIAEELGLSEETMRIIRIGGLLHDVGKIGVPEEILRKPGKLTDEEYELMKNHPQLGALIVAGVPGMESIIDVVRSHHERWDGRGYPDKLAGDDIPLLGRLLAVADAFSAMTTSRPYRKGLEWDVALEEIRSNAGTHFDPAMADSFLKAANKRRPTPASSTPVPAPSLLPVTAIAGEMAGAVTRKP